MQADQQQWHYQAAKGSQEGAEVTIWFIFVLVMTTSCLITADISPELEFSSPLDRASNDSEHVNHMPKDSERNANLLLFPT